MCIPPIDPPIWSPSDIATVIIAAVAVVVSVASVVSTFLVHRLQGSIVKVMVRYHVDLREKATYKPNAPEPDKEPKTLATSTVRKAGEIYNRFPADTHYATSFLRVIATNAGRIDASVDSISYVNKAKKGIVVQMKDEQPFPMILLAQTYITRDYLYSELVSHAGKKAKIRFEVALTNGKKSRSRWFKLQKGLSKP